MVNDEFYYFNEESYFFALSDILGADYNYFSDDESVSSIIELIVLTREIYTEFKRQKKVICRLNDLIKEKDKKIDFLENQAVGFTIDICNLNSKIKALQMDNEQLQCDIVNAIQNARR